MSAKKETEPANSTTRAYNTLPLLSRKRSGKRSLTRLIGGRSLSQAQNSTDYNHSEQVFPPTPENPHDHQTPERRLPLKALNDWYRTNTFRPAWLPEWLRYPVSGYLASVLLQVVAVMATLLLMQIFPPFTFTGLLEILFVALVAFTWGIIASIVATLAGAVLLNLVVLSSAPNFLPPHFSWSLARPSDIVAEVLFVVVSLVIGVFVSRIELAHRKAAKLVTSLAGERAYLDAVIETIPDMVSIHDAEGKIVRINRAARANAGTDQDGALLVDTQETYGLRFLSPRLDAVTGEPFLPEALPIARALQGETVSNVEMRALDSQGNDLYTLISAAPLRDPQGKIDGVVAITHDISALRQSELTAAIRFKELEATFDTMADAVFVFGSDGHVVRMNATARELFAMDVSADLSLPLHERGYSTVVLDEHDQPLPEDQWPFFRVIRGEVLTSANAMDMKVRTASGRELELSVSGAPLLDRKGHIVGAVCICRDVTERRILERRTHEVLNALLRMAESLVLVPDPATSTTGELVAINRTTGGYSRVAQRQVELTRSVLGCKRVAITSVEPETNEVRAIAVVGISAEQEREWRDRRPEFTLESMFVDSSYGARLQANEVLILDMTQPPFREQPNPYNIHTMLLAPMSIGAQLVGLLALDYGDEEHEYTPEEIALAGAVAKLGALVLERERLLRERAEARANEIALRTANLQMEEFLGMISHELRTPLTSIKGNAQLTLRQIKSSMQTFAKMLELQESAEHQSKRLNQMVDDLLDVSRSRTGRLELHPTRCDLASIVQESVAEQRSTWPGRTINLDIAAETPVPVHADADRIRQVITNYLTNALKYSDETQPVQVSLKLNGEEARVAVRDEGPGLPTEDLQQIWERFQRVPGIELRSTAHSANAGLGLGLYISKTIIEAHEGRVGVESAPGEGSTFWFTLPLALPDPQ